MVDFKLTPEQLAIQKSFREFAQNEIKPLAMELDQMPDHENIFPVDIFKKSFKIGLHEALIPTKYGGQGLDCLTCAIIWEEVAAADAGICVSFQGHALGIEFVTNSANEEQREVFLKAIMEGEGGIAAYAMTEPNVGPCWLLFQPDYTMETTAVLDGGEYVLNGVKNFCTNGGSPLTKWYVIHARTDAKSGGLDAHGFFLVWADTPGLKSGKSENKMGQRLSKNSTLYIDNLRVPKSQFIAIDTTTPPRERLTTVELWVLLGALAVGIARSAYEAALEYAKKRIIAGRPAIQHQLVGAKLADMHFNIEAVRSFVWKAAWHSDNNPQPDRKLTWGAKILGSDLAVKVTNEALQIHGGYGYTKDTLVEKLYRDAKVTQIYECPNELLRVTIATMLELGM